MSKSNNPLPLWVLGLRALLGLGLLCWTAPAALDPAGSGDGPAGPHDPGISADQPEGVAPAAPPSPWAPALRAPVPSTERTGLGHRHDSAGHAPCRATPELTVAFRRRAPGKRPLGGISRLSGSAVSHVARIGSARFPSDLGFSSACAGTARTPLYDLSAAYLL